MANNRFVANNTKILDYAQVAGRFPKKINDVAKIFLFLHCSCLAVTFFLSQFFSYYFLIALNGCFVPPTFNLMSDVKLFVLINDFLQSKGELSGFAGLLMLFSSVTPLMYGSVLRERIQVDKKILLAYKFRK